MLACEAFGARGGTSGVGGFCCGEGLVDWMVGCWVVGGAGGLSGLRYLVLEGFDGLGRWLGKRGEERGGSRWRCLGG